MMNAADTGSGGGGPTDAGAWDPKMTNTQPPIHQAPPAYGLP